MDGTLVQYGLPDPRHRDPGLFHARSRDALIGAVLAEADAGAGVVALRGQPGIGKTVMMKQLAQALIAPGCCIVTIGAYRATPLELQRHIADTAGLDRANALDPDRLLHALRVDGGYDTLILVLDDADKVGSATFRYLWLLRDLCPFAAMRLQLVMLGRPGPWDGLAHPDLETLRRESISQLFLPPLTDSEAASFLRHRLEQAGPRDGMTRGAVRAVLDRAAGIPSEIERLMAMALELRSRTKRRRITGRALRQILPPQPDDEREPRGRAGWAFAGVAALALTAGISVFVARTDQFAKFQVAAVDPAVAPSAGPDHRPDAVAPAAPAAEPATQPGHRLETATAADPAVAPAAGPDPQTAATDPAVAPPARPDQQIAAAVPGPAVAPPAEADRQIAAAAPAVAPAAEPEQQTAAASPALASAAEPDRQDAAVPPHEIAQDVPHSVLPQPSPSQVARRLTISPESARASATAPAPNHAGGPGLVLLAGRGDTMPTLYARVYRGVAPPPYALVAAANQLPIREGSLVVFPTPPHGWTVRGPAD